MLTIQFIDGRSCPRFICDHCGEPIERPNQGNAQWLEASVERQDGEYVDRVFHTHKHCCHDFERDNRVEGKRWMAQGLGVHIVYLLSNIGFTSKDWTRYMESAKRLASI